LTVTIASSTNGRRADDSAEAMVAGPPVQWIAASLEV
jgi:hypothetical protein